MKWVNLLLNNEILMYLIKKEMEKKKILVLVNLICSI